MRVSLDRMVYVGDEENPDVVIPNGLGMKTIKVSLDPNKPTAAIARVSQITDIESLLI